jgi:peptide deformylase
VSAEADELTAEVEAGAGEEPPGLDPEVLERRQQALDEVRQFGDPVLKSRASEVTSFDGELTAEAERMIGLMQGALGIGLAATQLGVMRRMLVFQAGPDADPRALINPEIEWTGGDLVTAEEGCLSLAGVTMDVERPLHARVRGQDLEGDRLMIEASGLEARVLQHEIDHLDGVLILDRTPREQRRAALCALRAGEHFDPSMLEPEAGSEEPGEPDPPE